MEGRIFTGRKAQNASPKASYRTLPFPWTKGQRKKRANNRNFQRSHQIVEK